MEVTGTIVSLSLNTQVAKKDGGSYPGAELIYKDGNGKVTTQAWHENSFKYDKALKNSLEGLKPGDSFVMVKEKEGDYWKVRSISKAAAISQEAKGEKPVAPASGNTYAENNQINRDRLAFDKEKQPLIIRQSSIASAASLAATLKLKSVEEVLTVASQFEAFVMGVNVPHETESQDTDSFENMDDDIPS